MTKPSAIASLALAAIVTLLTPGALFSAEAAAAAPAAEARASAAASNKNKPLLVLAGSSSGVTQRVYRRVTTDEQWAKLWTAHHSTDAAGYDPRPTVDFDRFTLVAAFDGPVENTAGMVLGSVTENADAVLVRFAFPGYATGGFVKPHSNTPYGFVLLPKTDKPIVLEQAVDERDPGRATKWNPVARLAAEKPEPSHAPAVVVPAGKVEPITTIAGDKSAIKQQAYHRVVGDEQWAKLWRNHRGPDNLADGEFQVDFDRCTIVAVFDGARANTSALQIRSVTEKPDAIVVRFAFPGYATGVNVEPHAVTPFGIIVLPKTDKPIVLEQDFTSRKSEPVVEKWKEVARLAAAAAADAPAKEK